MAAKRKVTQNDLRKMMAEMKSGTSLSKPSAPKKLKLNSKELALLEEEKRQKAVRDQERIRLKQEHMSRVVPNKDLQPKKSILKNNSNVSSNNYLPPQYIQMKKNVTVDRSVEVTNLERKSGPKDIPLEETNNTEGEEEETGKIPEGFFDDPKLDAKARQVQYVNVEEEEWQKFQKEIAEEEVQAQEILTEDRNEATTDRQIEEIDDQIEAWKRVAHLEVQKEKITHTKRDIKGDSDKLDSDEDSDLEEDLEELINWRKKC